ncbi:MAG TPA: cytochrome c oxidase subunit II [Ktedonobacterales bacterium]|jgi:cytochrome c oxidase subunit 2|nr:cytochrome c oxidase subunit II [Ktedonobacterales bacterium]
MNNNPRHILWASILFGVLAVVGLGIAFAIGPHFVQWGLLPPVASDRAEEINQVLALFSYLSIPVFALVIAYCGYAVFAFRVRGRQPTDGPHLTGNLRIQVIWVAVSILLAAILYADGLVFLNRVDAAAPSGALQVTVTGEQWLWNYDYPQYKDATSTELYLPVNRAVLFTVKSIDVQHSFWVPSMGIKEDAVPGETNQISVTPTVMGDYVVRCAELCGVYHAYMNTPVHVVSQSAFAAWVGQQPTAQPASSGFVPGAFDLLAVSGVVLRRGVGLWEG